VFYFFWNFLTQIQHQVENKSKQGDRNKKKKQMFHPHSEPHNIVIKCEPSHGFDETYSLHLTNYMSAQEFQQHIQYLNTIPRPHPKLFGRVAFILTIFILSAIFISIVPIVSILVLDAFIIAILSVVAYFIVLVIVILVYSRYLRRLSDRFCSEVKSYLNSINQQYIPRGIQWRLQTEQVNAGRYSMINHYLTIEIIPSVPVPSHPNYATGFPPQPPNPYIAAPHQQNPYFSAPQHPNILPSNYQVPSAPETLVTI